MIIVTGATGQLGRAIVQQLAARVPATQIGASARDPAKAAALAALGVRVRQGDFNDPASLQHAFEGASTVLIVSSNAAATGGDPLAQHRAAIAAARAAGAKRVVYTSHMAASATSAFPPARDHAATEEMLRQSGLPWTALRHGFYGASGLAMMGDALATGALETAADGKFSWAAHADLAEAAAIILAEIHQGHGWRWDGPTPPLTGAEALDFGDLAGIASALTGKSIVRTILTDDAMRAKIAARGAPPRAADMVLGLYTAARNGEFAAIDPLLERLLGRAPIRMRALMA
jgi:NAD(P)H dehydrogenase (quinone)